MMNLGPEKRRIIEKISEEHRFKRLLEVGTYCGYSAIVLSQCVLHPDAKIISLETNKKHADIARRILSHSGVRNVTVLGESMYEAASFLNEAGPFDLVFLDQEKEQYLPDLAFL
jgi:catechol O-methyltransferase